MEALQSTLRSAALRQLCSLQDKVERDLKIQNAINEKTRKIKELETRVQELLKKKCDLQQRLSFLTTETVESKLLRRVSYAEPIQEERKGAGAQHVDAVHKVLAHGMQRDECRRLKGLLRAHVFAGISVAALCKPERIAMKFGTAYTDRFFDTFCLELTFEGPLAKVFSSSLPDFVPVSALVDRHNSGEMELTHLLLEVHAYLMSYVERRQQIAEVSTKYEEYLLEEVASCPPYSIVCLRVGVPVGPTVVPLSLRLVYKDLRSSQPTRVQCSNTDQLHIERKQVKIRFLTVPLSEALQYLLDQVTLSTSTAS